MKGFAARYRWQGSKRPTRELSTSRKRSYMIEPTLDTAFRAFARDVQRLGCGIRACGSGPGRLRQGCFSMVLASDRQRVVHPRKAAHCTPFRPDHGPSFNRVPHPRRRTPPGSATSFGEACLGDGRAVPGNGGGHHPVQWRPCRTTGCGGSCLGHGASCRQAIA